MFRFEDLPAVQAFAAQETLPDACARSALLPRHAAGGVMQQASAIAAFQ